ncbi:hypothetical protein [Paenibacillus silvae]|uniref:Uncharacterized protein n=1 Tax=Paenibacillus silvae TaxID=1325358 RepID=A0A2W6PCJ0_9BACL|nr:hypothetical protein [Paenibacillus silvae]PZT57380.1 hypothetical protein DN757_01610 [Paenibacillus silvae]
MSIGVFILAILSSSFLAAVATGYVNNRINNKNVSLKYITEERAIWRKNIKETMSKLYAEALKEKPNEQLIREMATFMIINLNPQDKPKNKLDREITKLLFQIEKGNRRDEDSLVLLRYMVSVLMKHDWERSKNETKGFFSKAYDERIEKDTLSSYYVPTQQKEPE